MFCDLIQGRTNFVKVMQSLLYLLHIHCVSKMSRSHESEGCKNGRFQSLSPSPEAYSPRTNGELRYLKTILNFNWTYFWYPSLFGVKWCSNLGCSTFGKQILLSWDLYESWYILDKWCMTVWHWPASKFKVKIMEFINLWKCQFQSLSPPLVCM